MVWIKDSLHHQTPMEKYHCYSCLGIKDKSAQTRQLRWTFTIFSYWNLNNKKNPKKSTNQKKNPKKPPKPNNIKSRICLKIPYFFLEVFLKNLRCCNKDKHSHLLAVCSPLSTPVRAVACLSTLGCSSAFHLSTLTSHDVLTQVLKPEPRFRFCLPAVLVPVAQPLRGLGLQRCWSRRKGLKPVFPEGVRSELFVLQPRPQPRESSRRQGDGWSRRWAGPALLGLVTLLAPHEYGSFYLEFIKPSQLPSQYVQIWYEGRM